MQSFMSDKHAVLFMNIIEFYDAKSPIDIIYLEFQKACDKVHHKHLVSKLNSIGIRGELNNWIKCCLTERRQQVVLNETSSYWGKVRSGVPQRSVLGPVPSIIFINDLDSNILSNIGKFANNTKQGGIVQTKLVCEQIQFDLNKIVEWS
ncbi:putative RNA-directed DNA polymerase from transposon BS, partial [Dictyocoela roeselum]